MFPDKGPASNKASVLNASNISSKDTIESQILALNQAATGGAGTYVAEDFLADKEALVFGKENSPPQEIAAALARIYGLRLVAEPATEVKEKQLRLTRPRVVVVTEVKELPVTLARLLPDPLVRIVRGDSISTSPTPVTPALDENGFPPLPLYLQRMEFGKRLRNAAILRIEQVLLPVLQAKPAKQIPLSETGVEVKNFLAIVLMMDNWDALSKLTNTEQPHYITNPSDVYLQGDETLDKVTGKRQGFRLSLTYKDAKGGLAPEVIVIRKFPDTSPK